MYKKTLVIVVLLIGCSGQIEGMSLDIFVTYTPDSFPTPTGTATSSTVTPLPIITTVAQPTSTCTATPIPVPTVEGQHTWKYVVLRYYLLQCVAQDLEGAPINCRIRQEPNLLADYRTVPYGTRVEATALHHCEVYLSCDPDIIEWYYLTSGEWAAALSYVWQDITPTGE